MKNCKKDTKIIIKKRCVCNFLNKILAKKKVFGFNYLFKRQVISERNNLSENLIDIKNDFQYLSTLYYFKKTNST